MRKRIFFLLFAIELITISCNTYYEEFGDMSPYVLNEILYLTKTGTPIELNISDGWGATLLFNVYENGLGRIIFGQIVTHIPSRAFENCNELRAIYIPEGVIYVGDNLFKGCNYLELIIVGKRVSSIESQAFCGCTGELVLNCNCFGLYGGAFTKLVIGDGVTSIEDRAFSGYESLTNVTIGNSVRWIGEEAFSGCRNIISATISSGVTSIGGGAFDDCTSLKEIYCKPTTPPIVNMSMFESNASGRKIYVPRNSVEAYKTAKGWKEYAEDIVGYDF